MMLQHVEQAFDLPVNIGNERRKVSARGWAMAICGIEVEAVVGLGVVEIGWWLIDW